MCNCLQQAAKEAASNLKDLFPQLIIEVSGGVTELNIAQLFSPFINVISSSTLTQVHKHTLMSLLTTTLL